LVGDDSLIAADFPDLAEYWTRKREGLSRVLDGSNPQKGIAPGYALFEASARNGRGQLSRC
jgi:hypothetical protein